ncbi:hypothetical protein LY78DRAFT_686334 [Colletotrichum sublineola]|nr:hypothetical protein LY78DRAFT_686334 [Colletotrichum sublineola]
MTLITRILTIALVITATEACAKFSQCRCTMANGAINNTMTILAAANINNQVQNFNNSILYPIDLDSSGTTFIESTTDQNNCPILLANCAVREAYTVSEGCDRTE